GPAELSYRELNPPEAREVLIRPCQQKTYPLRFKPDARLARPLPCPWQRQGTESEAIMVVQCCACKRVRTESGWTEVSDPEDVARHASHGYCPSCVAEAYSVFSAQLSHQKLPPAA